MGLVRSGALNADTAALWAPMGSITDETMQSELVQCGIRGMTSMCAAPMGKRGNSDTRHAEVVRDISILML